MNLYYAVVSTGRPGNVPMMEALLAPITPTWYVKAGEAGDYLYSGATDVCEVDGGLADQRNAALSDAFENDDACVQLDDDLHPWNRHVNEAVRYTSDGTDRQALTVIQAVEVMVEHMGEATLAGIAPTTNLYFYSRAVSKAFCPACFTVSRPNEIRFDATLKLKEDYDYTLQHLRSGGVARCNGIVANFGRYTARGGAATYRTPELEQATCDLLLARWPQYLRRNPRRDHELLLKWKP